MIMGFVGRGAPRHGLTRDAKSNQWGEVIAYSFQHSIDSWRLSHPRVLANFQCFFGNERPKPNVNHYAKTLEPKIKKEDRRSERNDESISTIQTQAGRAGIERHKSCLRSRSAFADCVKVRGLKMASAFRRWIRALETRATTRAKGCSAKSRRSRRRRPSSRLFSLRYKSGRCRKCLLRKCGPLLSPISPSPPVQIQSDFPEDRDSSPAARGTFCSRSPDRYGSDS